jgi:hypothetical protein
LLLLLLLLLFRVAPAVLPLLPSKTDADADARVGSKLHTRRVPSSEPDTTVVVVGWDVGSVGVRDEEEEEKKHVAGKQSVRIQPALLWSTANKVQLEVHQSRTAPSPPPAPSTLSSGEN